MSKAEMERLFWQIYHTPEDRPKKALKIIKMKIRDMFEEDGSLNWLVNHKED